MPPKGIPRAAADQIEALIKFVEGEFEKADRNREARSGPRHGAPAEPRRVFEYDPRSAGVDFRPKRIFRPTIPATASTTSATS